MMRELNVNELQEVNGGSQWFRGLLIGTAIGELWSDYKSNPSSYGSKYDNRFLMHAKY